MKIMQSAFLVLLLAAAAFSLPQDFGEAVTTDLGMGAFASDSGPILLTVDSALVSRTLGNPYVMFYAYMASRDGNRKISVAAKEIVVMFNGRELTMPTVSELRSSYKGINRDYERYNQLGKEGVIASWVRNYQFPPRPNFYPPMNMSTEVAVDTGSMFGFYGFQTPLYLKNPGFSKGDKLTFVVKDRKDSSLTSECEVVIK
ncbi:MAG: hypothetical protein JW843_06700 [Candidatus Aminicenantes bacterium]|nr:hypothetical protein [Candidatus Aminicenantes bacterium]